MLRYLALSPSLPWSSLLQPTGSMKTPKPASSLSPPGASPKKTLWRPHDQALSPPVSFSSLCITGSSRPWWPCPQLRHPLCNPSPSTSWSGVRLPGTSCHPHPHPLLLSSLAAHFLLSVSMGIATPNRNFLSSASSGPSTVQTGQRGHFSQSCYSHSQWYASCFHPCSWPQDTLRWTVMSWWTPSC